MTSRVLETTANAAIILTCVAICGVLVVRFGPLRHQVPALKHYEVGTVMDAIPGLEYGLAKRTLILVVRTACKYCTESAPFYRDVIEKRGTWSAKTRIVALSVDDVVVASRYLATHGVFVDDVIRLPRETVQNVATPTLVLVSRSGTVLRSWVGRLSPEGEREVFAALAASILQGE